MSLVLGSDSGFFSQVNDAVPNCTDRRVYYDTPNGWPTSWPTIDGASATMSIRPYPNMLVSGQLDDQLRPFVQSAPKGQRLACFHECSNLSAYNNAPWLYPDGTRIVSAANMQKIHKYMMKFLNDPVNNPNGVAYGVIMCCPPDQMGPWMGSGLDWYGVDIYDWAQFHFNGDFGQALDISPGGRLETRFDEWQSAVKTASGQDSPRLHICETNSTNASHRPKWFTACAEFLTARNGRVMDTFWSDKPDTVGPFDPTDQPTIDALKALG